MKQDIGDPESSGDAAIVARTPQFVWLANGLTAAVGAFEKERLVNGQLVCPANVAATGGNVHDFGDYALARHVLSTNLSDLASTDAAVRCLFTFQTNGVFAFHPGDAPRLSDNSNEFALLPLGPMLNRYRVDASLRADVTPKIIAGLDAIETHPVCPAYTNICLMQAAELLSLGKWLAQSSDATTAAYGQARIASGLARIDQWLQFTHDDGVSEFDSPTYSEVQLEVLLAARLAAPDALARGRIDAASEHLWANLAASFWQGRGLLSGPLSRTYDFVTAMGGVSLSLYVEGLRTDLPTQSADLAKAILLLNADLGGYHPGASTLSIAKSSGREVKATWGTGAGQQRYLWVDSAFTLGSASADYGTSLSSDQDQLIRAELGASASVPAIAVIPDYLDHPGTSVKAGSFNKVTHLLMSPASVQQGGAMLSLLRIPAADPRYVGSDGKAVPLVNLATNVVFPSQVDEVLVDGAPGQLSKDVTAHSTVVLRIGSGAIALGVLSASGLECPAADGSISESGTADVHVKPLSGASSVRGGTARLAIYHLKAIPSDTSKLSKCFARVALLMAGTHCQSATCAADLSSSMAAAIAQASPKWNASNGDWDVTAPLLGSTLHVHRVVGANPSVLAREVNGQAVAFAPLEVNGTPVALQPPSRLELSAVATTQWGENVFVVGDAPALGAWNTAKAVKLSPSAYPTWTADVDVAGASTVQFKLLKKDSAGNVTWESGANRQLFVPISGVSYQASWR